MDALTYQALKTGLPGTDDETLMNLWGSMEKNIPGMKDMDPKVVAKIIVDSANASRAKVQTPYSGTAMEARNPQNPQAEHMNQFDPAARDAALADYNQRRAASLGQRDMSRGFAAQAGAEGINVHNSAWGDVDKYNMLQSLEHQKAKQEQATAGISAGTGLAGQFKSAEELKQAQQKTEAGIYDIATMRRMNDPESTETLLAKAMLKDQIAGAGGGATAEMQAALSKPGVTAQQIKAFFKPDVLDSYEKKLNINKKAADVQQTNIENQNLIAQGKGFSRQEGIPIDYSLNAPGSIRLGGNTGAAATPTATPAGMKVSPAQQQTADAESLRIIKSEYDKEQDPTAKEGLFREMMRISKQANLPNPVSGAGAGRGNVNPPLASAIAPVPQNWSKVSGALTQSDNLDPKYISERKLSDLSEIQKLERQRLESNDAAENIRLGRQIAQLKGEPFTVAGSASPTVYTPSGKGFSAANTNLDRLQASDKRVREKSDSVQVFDASGKPAAQNAFLLSNKAGYDKIGNLVPLTSEDSARLQLQVDRLNAEAMRLGQVVGAGSNTGASAAAGALGAIHPLLGAAAGTFASLAEQRQPITNKTPPEVIKQFSVATQLAAQRQRALVAKEASWAASHNGDTSGFQNSSDYKHVMNAEAYVNPKTGDVVLPLSRSQQDDLLQNGYGPLSRVSFKTPNLREQ